MPVSKKRKKNERVANTPKDVTYICIECGNKEEIPHEVVKTFDEMDQSNINEPPQFTCEKCDGLMRPQKYVSIHGKVFEYKKDSEN